MFEAFNQTRPAAVRILIVDDDKSFRTFVKRLLGSAVEVVGEAADAESAVHRARDLAPDLVLMDVEIPPMGAIPTTRLIKATDPTTRVLIFTANGEEAYLNSTGRAGADAILPKRVAPEKLLSTIKSLARPVGAQRGIGRHG